MLGEYPGIEKKLYHQYNAIKRLGLNDFEIVALNTRFNGQKTGIQFVKLRDIMRYARGYALYNFMKNLIEPYEKLVLRYPTVDLSFFFLKDIIRSMPVFTEHHSKEVFEVSVNAKSVLKRKLSIFFENHFFRPALGEIKGVIGLTNEICAYELKRLGKTKPAVVIPNGVDVENVPFTKFRKFDGKNLNMIFISGNFQPWQGLDRIFESLLQFKNRSLNLKLYVVGNVNEETRKLISQVNTLKNIEIEIAGVLTGEKLDSIFTQATIAVSSLSLYRKGMVEACALKTREYTARGIPFILGYDDPDFKEDEDFFMRLPNTSGLFDFDEVIDFALKVSANPEISNYMRNFAMKRLDWKTKMLKMWEFVVHN